MVYIKTDSVAQIFPSGDYKVTLATFTEKIEPLTTAIAYASLISSDKNTFG